MPAGMYQNGIVALAVCLLMLTVKLFGSNSVLFRSDPDFHVNFSALTVERHMKGSAGGVYILNALQNGTLTLKFNRDSSHFEEEILADRLYSVLGAAVPKFIVTNNFSTMPAKLQEIVNVVPFVRIAEFIKADKYRNEAELADQQAQHFQDYFVVDAFMANRDASKEGNCVRSNGTFYHIDNGGSLRNRLMGKKKGAKTSDHWDADLVPELKSLVKHRPDLYGALTEDAILSQAQEILKLSNELMDTIKTVAAALSIEPDTESSLSSMMRHRLHMLQMITQAGSSFPAYKHKPVTALMGAGALLICDVKNMTSVLLGERKSSEAEKDKKWVTLGGKSDFKSDTDLLETAMREIFEESMGHIKLHLEHFVDAPYHDFVHPEYLFRQYFVRLKECPNAATLLSGEPAPSLKNNPHTGRVEYHRFKWFPLSLLREVSPLGDMGSTGETAFPAFASLLQVPHVQWLLQRLEEGQEILSVDHRYTQSTPVRVKGVPMYAEFL